MRLLCLEIKRIVKSRLTICMIVIAVVFSFLLATIIKVSVHMSPAFGYDAYGRTASGL